MVKVRIGLKQKIWHQRQLLTAITLAKWKLLEGKCSLLPLLDNLHIISRHPQTWMDVEYWLVSRVTWLVCVYLCLFFFSILSGSYTPTGGISYIQCSVSNFISRRDGGVPSSPENIFMTSGSQRSIMVRIIFPIIIIIITMSLIHLSLSIFCF
jgi:hypothetical protein